MPAQDTDTATAVRPRTAARRWGSAVAVAAAAGLLAGVPATASAQDHHQNHQNRQQHSSCHDRSDHHNRNNHHRTVSVREAIGIAEHVIHGTVISAELEKMKVERKDKKARTVWEVEVERKGTGYEVLIDPRTGCVLKAGKEERDD